MRNFLNKEVCTKHWQHRDVQEPDAALLVLERLLTRANEIANLH